MSAVLVGLVQVMLAQSTSEAVTRVLGERADDLVSAADASSRRNDLVVPDSRLDPGAAVYDAEGQLVAGHAAPALEERFAELAGSSRRASITVDNRYQLLAVPFETASGAAGVVVVAEALHPYQDDKRQALLVSLAAGLVIVVLGTALAAWVTRRALRPVAQMASTAENWSEHNLQRRFDLGPPTNELTSLAHTLDGLLDKVAEAIGAEQRLTAEMAHELRSSLTAVQLTAELTATRPGLDEEVREDVRHVQEACATMMTTMTTLLELARSQAELRGQGPCSLADAVDQVADAMVDSRALEVEVDPAIQVAVPLSLAVRAIAPVIENAVRVADHVRVSATLDADLVVLEVVDDGPGVPEVLKESVFVPGQSGSGGTGLGLALARRVARTVGGDVRVAHRPGHRGAVFVIELPRWPG